MSKLSKIHTQVCKYASAVLMLVLLVLQFVPFWNAPESGKISISQYVWFPYKYTDVEPYIAEAIGNAEYTVNSSVLVPVLILALCVVGVVYCLVSKKITYVAFPAVCGLVGIVGYLVKPEFMLGSGWILHLIPCVLMLAVAVIALITKVKDVQVGN